MLLILRYRRLVFRRPRGLFSVPLCCMLDDLMHPPAALYGPYGANVCFTATREFVTPPRGQTGRMASRVAYSVNTEWLLVRSKPADWWAGPNRPIRQGPRSTIRLSHTGSSVFRCQYLYPRIRAPRCPKKLDQRCNIIPYLPCHTGLLMCAFANQVSSRMPDDC